MTVFADDAGTKKTLAGAQAALEIDLHKLDTRHGIDRWDLQVTPPFPDGVAWVVYGYAQRFSPQLSDGLHVGTVFAEARPTAGGYALKRLAEKLGEIGIQGVHPVSVSEGSAWPTAQETLTGHSWVAGGHRDAMPPVVKRVYCAWKRGNGLVAAKLPLAATTFLDGLACK